MQGSLGGMVSRRMRTFLLVQTSIGSENEERKSSGKWLIQIYYSALTQTTGSETSPSYAPGSSRFGSELPSVEDDVDVWRYAIVSCMPETTTTDS